MTGPLASNNLSLVGNYNGISSNMKTIVEGVAAKVSPSTRMQYRQGALLTTENLNSIDWFSGQAVDADATIVVLGLTLLLEGEEGESIASSDKGDRTSLKLPQNQIDFIKKIKRNSENPLVLVLTGGSPIAIPELHDLVDAILFVWYPGEEGGNAVADVIFGDINPSGKLPITFPKSEDQLPPYIDYNMAGRTYKFMTEEPLYPFGFGLSYTTFEYSNLNISDSFIVTVDITNSGKIEGEEVIQLYISSPLAGKEDPIYDLKSFKRETLGSGETKTITFNLNKETFSQFDTEGKEVLRRGTYTLYVGGTLPSQRSIDLGASKTISKKINF